MSDSIRAALERLVFLDGCADQSPDWKQAWRDAMAAAQAALAGHDRQIGSSADTGLLPMIASETGSDDEPEIERIICSSISGGADYVNGMPRELSLQRIKGGKSVFARYTQGPLEVAGPTPSPAGGLVERVRDAMLITQSIEENARAAIRAVADWLRSKSGGGSGMYWSQRMEQEAGR